jgi:membrane protease YdiL (CAAX protease family)
MLVLFAALFLPGILAQTGSVDPGAFNSVTYHIQTMTLSLAQCLLVLHILTLHPNHDPNRFGIRSPQLRPVLLGAVLGIGLLVLVMPVGALEEYLSEGDRALTPGVRFSLDRPELLPLVIPTALAIAYREEVFFRAFLIPRLQDLGMSPTSAVVISTAAFSLGHLYQGILGGLVTAVIGALLGVLFLRYRDVHLVAVAHGVYNAAVLATSYFISG